jgi:hypothetical protein
MATRLRTILLAASLLLLLAACTVVARPEYMALDPDTSPAILKTSPFKKSIALGDVAGGTKYEQFPGIPTVENDALREAVRLNLSRTDLLGAEGARPPYRLDVTLVATKAPHWGYTLTITSFVRYVLVRSRDEGVVFDEMIDAPGVAYLREEYLGFNRFRLALERSIKNNIAAFLMRLGNVDPAPRPPV